jgi:hypothetical protein
MIHVDVQPEPDDFEALVRAPGREFLEDFPNPTQRQWNTHSYWRRILGSLHHLYRGICAFSCHWIPYDTGADTVEHFLPKRLHPNQAYEWLNYRLVCGTLNGRKGEFQDVLDPFEIEDGWFTIEFPSLLVKPASGLDEDLTASIRRTIHRLRLNDEGTCLKSRAKFIELYCKQIVPFDYLELEAPFIAKELQRQNLTADIRQVMLYDEEHGQP